MDDVEVGGMEVPASKSVIFTQKDACKEADAFVESLLITCSALVAGVWFGLLIAAGAMMYTVR